MPLKIEFTDTPLVLSGAIYEAIGRVTAAFSELEHSVHLLLAALLKVEDVILHTVTANMQFARVVETTQSVAALVLSTEDNAVLQPLLVTAATLGQSRNSMVHCRWLQTTKPHIALHFTIRARGTLQEKKQRMTPKSITNIAKQILSHGVLLMQAGFDLGLLKAEDFALNAFDRSCEL